MEQNCSTFVWLQQILRMKIEFDEKAFFNVCRNVWKSLKDQHFLNFKKMKIPCKVTSGIFKFSKIQNSNNSKFKVQIQHFLNFKKLKIPCNSVWNEFFKLPSIKFELNLFEI